MTDCLIIGHNDYNFPAYAKSARAFGPNSGAFRDLNLAFIEHEGEPLRALDVLSRQHRNGGETYFSNSDFLWPTIVYLGSYLHRRGFTFDYISQFHRQQEELKEKLLHEDIRTVAITTTLYIIHHPIAEIIAFIRRHNDRVKIIVGGPYIAGQARAMDEKTLAQHLAFLGADYYVISEEGEQALADLLTCLKDGGEPARVRNLAYREGDAYVRTPSQTEENSLEDNMIDYDLFPERDLDQFVSIRTAKSCPFACAFCAFPELAGAYRYLDVGRVEQELNALNDRGISTVTVLDDTFNVPQNRFKDLLRMMARNRYDFKWNSFFRSDHSDAETIELMGRAGCEGVFLGMESGSDRILKAMNKTARQKHYAAAIPRLRDAGILTYASLIVGYPGETEETHAETVQFIEDIKPDFFRGQLWYAGALTPVFRRAEELGIKGRGFTWRHDTMDARTACDLIDRMFLRVQNSTWLPQYGFEQWSTYYLQRKGMSRGQLMNFLKIFNLAVKDKLRHPEQREISPARFAELDAACQF